MRTGLVLLTAATLAGCSASEGPQATSSETGQSEMAAPQAKKGAANNDKVQVKLPQLAYAYALAFVLPADKIAAAQDKHRELCEQLGANRCQLLALQRDGGTDRSGEATLKLRVATADASAFSNSLTASITQAGGRAEATNVAAEDVSRKITDAAARIGQRELLVARLTEVLRTRKGTVAELVEAERSVAQGQEELDQAKAWLAELRGRVAMSDFEIHYSAIAPSASPGSTASLLGEAALGSGASFLIGLRGLLTVLIYLLPWALVAGAIILLARRLRKLFGERTQA